MSLARPASAKSLDEALEAAPGLGAAATADAAADAAAARRVAQVIEDQLLTMMLQPVLSLQTMRLAGAEALARFHSEPAQSPSAWFADARRAGLGTELQMLAVRRAFEAARLLPKEAFVAVNLDLQGASHPGLGELLSSSPRPVVLELTEDVGTDDYPRLHRAIEQLRERGVRLAVDDSSSSGGALLDLAPDLVKLDIDLVRGIDADPTRQSIVAAVVALGAGTGSEVVAEGIETEAELSTLRGLQVGYGQGYLLGRPVGPALLAPSPTAAKRGS